MPDADWLAKGTCSQCGRPIAQRSDGPGRVEVACNVCHTTTSIEAAPRETAPRSRWSWPVVVAILGAFFVAGLAVSLFLGGDEAPDPLPTFPTSAGPTGPTPGGAPSAATPSPVVAGRAVHVYVNDTTNGTHEVTISLWRDDTERASVVVGTGAMGEGPHARFDPEAAAFELRIAGEAGGAVLVRAFDAPRCGAEALDVELVIGDEGRFRWGRVGCAALSSG